MVEDVYKLAEKKMLQGATEMQILNKAQDNARLIFKPFLESISGKKVTLTYK
jgi:hypothetical protein